MRCPRCGFQNMPGRTSCFRCSSLLDTGTLEIDVHPPRASRRRKSFRSAVRWLGLRLPFRLLSQGRRLIAEWVSDRGEDAAAICDVILSALPGLAHIVHRRFQTIRWYCLAWVILVAVALFFYGSFLHFALLGVCVGLHAWIAADAAALFKCVTTTANRVLALLLIVALLGILYWAVGGLVLGGFTGGHTVLEIAHQDVRPHDFLLVRRSAGRRHPLPRGALVLASLYGSSVPMVGEIIGLPGETVETRDGTFYVNGQELGSDQYPVPEWLKARTFGAVVPEDNYFVSAGFRLYAGAGVNVEPFVRSACIVPQSAIRGRAIMRWLPVRRRGFLKEAE